MSKCGEFRVRSEEGNVRWSRNARAVSVVVWRGEWTAFHRVRRGIECFKVVLWWITIAGWSAEAIEKPSE